ncbi:GNAT family N-acetyltransferase [Dehalobacter sp. DCM]|uniref:GNAT family N-acetyltransferase n=1 Tax=Dehalobacter sp. DCM TaxID=2907827 RepID=UPI0030820AAF|nr:GNAT family N-acetyltransferase [Dehalobacter sp. DCM]
MLKGTRTWIRPLDPEDLDSLYDWYNDPEFSYYTSGNWPLATLLRREEIERRFYDEDPNRYAITDLEGRLIGTIGFDQVNIPARSARLFIGIGDKLLWGKGYGSDALRTFIRYLFRQWNFHRLTVETWKRNERAVACYEKLGFVTEGILRDAYYVDGEYEDAILLGLLRQDFSMEKSCP